MSGGSKMFSLSSSPQKPGILAPGILGKPPVATALSPHLEALAATAVTISPGTFDDFTPTLNPTLPLSEFSLATIGFTGSILTYSSQANLDTVYYWNSLEEVDFTGPVGPIAEDLVLVDPITNVPTVTFSIGTSPATFTLLSYLGRGSYGYVFKARMTDSANDTEVAIKFQGADTDRKKIQGVKEIIAQHYIHEATAYNNHSDCTYTGKIFRVGKLNHIFRNIKAGLDTLIDICVTVMELATLDLSGFLESSTSPVIHQNATKACIILSRKLHNLWKTYEFNHCDFHCGNVLLYYIAGPPNEISSYNLKLADFGFSQFKIVHPENQNSLEIKLLTRYVSKSDRDIVLLLADFHFHRGCIAYLYGQQVVNAKRTTANLKRRVDYQTYINTNHFPSCIPYEIVFLYNDRLRNPTWGTFLFPGLPYKDNACNPPKRALGPNNEPFRPAVNPAVGATSAQAAYEEAFATGMIERQELLEQLLDSSDEGGGVGGAAAAGEAARLEAIKEWEAQWDQVSGGRAQSSIALNSSSQPSAQHNFPPQYNVEAVQGEEPGTSTLAEGAVQPLVVQPSVVQESSSSETIEAFAARVKKELREMEEQRAEERRKEQEEVQKRLNALKREQDKQRKQGGAYKTRRKTRRKLRKRTRKQRGGRDPVKLNPMTVSKHNMLERTANKTAKARNVLPTYSNFGSSMENYYHWLRVECFPDENLKPLFKAMTKVNLRDIVSKLNGKSIDQLLALCKAQEQHVAMPNASSIIDAYLDEEDPELSYDLLRFLMFTNLPKSNLTSWLERYMKSEPEDRREMLPKVIYSARFI